MQTLVLPRPEATQPQNTEERPLDPIPDKISDLLSKLDVRKLSEANPRVSGE